MKLQLLYETKPYSEMTPKQRSRARRARAEKYAKDRKKYGRKASGSNEANKKSTAKWRSENPDKAAQVNRVNYRVRKKSLPRVKDGKHRHHSSYFGKDGGRFLSVKASTNARKANQKRIENRQNKKD